MNQYNKLIDKKQNGKEKNWRGKKIGSKILFNSHMRLGNEKKGTRIYQCGDRLFFKADPNNLGDKRLSQAYFCGDKLCPMCAMRRSEKLFGQTNQIIDCMDKENGYRYVFLTLTVRNMPGGELKSAIDAMMKGFNFLTKRKEFKDMSKGWMRSMEVTVNWKDENYHPHVHMIIAVDKKYFTEYENYLKHEDWLRLWKSCLKLDYDPYVYVEKVKMDGRKEDGSISYKKAVSELTKYTVKSQDYLITWTKRGREYYKKASGGKELENRQHAEKLTDSVVGLLNDVLYKRRLVAFGGRMKEVHKLLNLDDPIDGNLENVDGNEDTDGKYTVDMIYKWCPVEMDYLLDKEMSDPLFVRYQGEVFEDG